MTALLPPNSTAGERAIEDALLARIDLAAVGTLWNPESCPPEVLPFLAWGLAISHWNPEWTVAQKRTAIAEAIPFHQRKGTRAVVEEVLLRFHPLLTVTEWWETSPPRTPHTFEVRAPAAIGADFLTPETAEAIIRDVAAAKPLRSHFDFVHVLEVQAAAFLAGGLIPGTMHRADYAAGRDSSRDWDAVFQTEQGEPIESPDGTILETH